jgi:antitoxin (DNA-binding transcriptional repressor) of toxin-antitoxin stability system
VKTITIRDLRQRWPEAEAALKADHEILITRDGKPVAKLVRFAEPELKRRQWDPERHAARIKGILGDKLFPSVDAQLAEERADRKL